MDTTFNLNRMWTYNAQSPSRSTTFDSITNDNDTLGYRVQDFDIWRYRVYGTVVTHTQGNIVNGFYDLVLPQPVTETYQTGASCCDWYQPLQENGNILSYPQLINSAFTPSDLGPYINLTGTTVVTPFLTGHVLTFNGNGGGIQLNWSDTTGNNQMTDWSPNTLLSRKQMRGLFFLNDTPDIVSKAYDPLIAAPASGDKVHIESRVYNYSVSQPINNLLVQFEVIAYDTDDDTEVPFTYLSF